MAFARILPLATVLCGLARRLSLTGVNSEAFNGLVRFLGHSRRRGARNGQSKSGSRESCGGSGACFHLLLQIEITPEGASQALEAAVAGDYSFR
jgi:hypothetical protein